MPQKVYIKWNTDDIDSRILPVKKHEGDACYDLRSIEDYDLQPGEIHPFDTGFSVGCSECKRGVFLGIVPRSGLASKGISVSNCLGIVDQGYTGPVKVLLINLSKEPFHVSAGDRIAQMLMLSCEDIEFVETDSLDNTERGSNGFGSTGVK